MKSLGLTSEYMGWGLGWNIKGLFNIKLKCVSCLRSDFFLLYFAKKQCVFMSRILIRSDQLSNL